MPKSGLGSCDGLHTTGCFVHACLGSGDKNMSWRIHQRVHQCRKAGEYCKGVQVTPRSARYNLACKYDALNPFLTSLKACSKPGLANSLPLPAWSEVGQLACLHQIMPTAEMMQLCGCASRLWLSLRERGVCGGYGEGWCGIPWSNCGYNAHVFP